MTHLPVRLALLATLALAACSSNPPPPDWQMTAHSGLDSAAQAWMEGRDRVEAIDVVVPGAGAVLQALGAIDAPHFFARTQQAVRYATPQVFFRDGDRLMIVAINERQWQGLVRALDLQAGLAALEARHGVSFTGDDGVRYTLLGTAHVSQASIEAVRNAIDSGRFDAVSAVITVAAAFALFRFKVGVMPLLGACAAVGLAVSWLLPQLP